MIRHYYFIAHAPSEIYVEVADGSRIPVPLHLDLRQSALLIGSRIEQIFRWTRYSAGVLYLCAANPEELLVVDDHGIRFVGRSFIEIVNKIPIWYESGESEPVLAREFHDE